MRRRNRDLGVHIDLDMTNERRLILQRQRRLATLTIFKSPFKEKTAAEQEHGKNVRNKSQKTAVSWMNHQSPSPSFQTPTDLNILISPAFLRESGTRLNFNTLQLTSQFRLIIQIYTSSLNCYSSHVNSAH